METTISKLARHVIGIGEPTRPATKAVKRVTIKGVDRLELGGYRVELSDESQWMVPPQAGARFNTAWTYTELSKK